jgi:hypothetical protein
MSLLLRIRFRLGLWAWARMLPPLAWRRGLEALVRLTEVGPGAPYRGLAPDYIARRVKRATRHPWLMRDRPCLRQGLLAVRFLRLAGYHPVLHFGVDRASVQRDLLSAHCWVSLDGAVVLNPASPGMVEILTYAGDRLAPSVPAKTEAAAA